MVVTLRGEWERLERPAALGTVRCVTPTILERAEALWARAPAAKSDDQDQSLSALRSLVRAETIWLNLNPC
ncbi:hypothetical protein MOX02_57300 [Methylobacterium oxalidis]|uniref:Uncharacterized protein n=1 Tax=Methylobacterium oxalidis TaxID=944322 RepID=A0A512JCL3_9HYPH|nr:hypothetical protein MOX02_57300 [Methylobacterium oxalidis]GLS64860.1 hypothetical protein GCM10007888_32410 [Methylobacterium oxalidis]